MILLIETSTLNCSVALGDASGVVAHREETAGQYVHAERLHVLIDELLATTGVDRTALSAIAVGRGPGSFTGLRIGVSAAKGMCVGLGLPLLAPCPLKALQYRGGLAHPALLDRPDRIVPAIDARRMDLYTFGVDGTPQAAMVEATFRPDIGAGPALLIGDGAEKCRAALEGHPADWAFIQAYPSAADLLPQAVHMHADGQFEDVPDFEPFYLKDFIPGRPKDPLGLRSTAPS